MYFYFICIYVLYSWFFVTGFLQVEKEWRVKELSTWNLPLICHSLSSRLIFEVFWHPYNANSEFYYWNHKIFQFQAHLKPWQILKKKEKVTIPALKHFCGCADKWGLVKSPRLKLPQLLIEREWREVQNDKFHLIFRSCLPFFSLTPCIHFAECSHVPRRTERILKATLQLCLYYRTRSSSHFLRN